MVANARSKVVPHLSKMSDKSSLSLVTPNPEVFIVTTCNYNSVRYSSGGLKEQRKIESAQNPITVRLRILSLMSHI